MLVCIMLLHQMGVIMNYDRGIPCYSHHDDTVFVVFSLVDDLRWVGGLAALSGIVTIEDHAISCRA